MTGAITLDKGFLAVLRQWRQIRADVEEKKAIAKAFNDRYTYRVKYRPDAPYNLPGTSYGGPHSSGYAWMCPECNIVHGPIADSVFTGLQYPACCTTGEGHRIHAGIRAQ